MLKRRGVQASAKRLSVDIADAITEFKAVMREFKLKQDIYRIIFRGKGLEFESYRSFGPDDDATDIDWKASSRAQSLLVKQYKEERDLKIMFLVDVGSNMVFGSQEKLKCEYTTELVAAFAKYIMEGNDQVGFFLFSDGMKEYIKPKRGGKHFEYFCDVLTQAKTYGGVTNLDLALEQAMTYLDPSIDSVILISDFLRISHSTEKRLNLLSHLFETMIMRVRDPLDITLPNVEGEISLSNPVSGEQVVVNPKVVRVDYEKHAAEQASIVKHMIEKSEADLLDLYTSKPFSVPLALFLRERLLKK